MNIIQVVSPSAMNGNGAKSPVVAGRRRRGAPGPSAAADVSPVDMEIADRVVDPAGTGQAGGGSHHH
jgi:hypothetical protein